MERTVDVIDSRERNTTLPTVDDVRRMIAESRNQADGHRCHPIDIRIDLGSRGIDSSPRRDEDRFALFRSKLLWVVLALVLSATLAYARTRYVCQSFKDTGRFFYGMGVDRCIGVLIKQPFERVDSQLDLINRSY